MALFEFWCRETEGETCAPFRGQCFPMQNFMANPAIYMRSALNDRNACAFVFEISLQYFGTPICRLSRTLSETYDSILDSPNNSSLMPKQLWPTKPHPVTSYRPSKVQKSINQTKNLNQTHATDGATVAPTSGKFSYMHNSIGNNSLIGH